WLAIDSPKSKTPNFDIASTCTIENKPGLLLTEAKAHDAELLSEAAGKRLNPDASRGSKVNHERIAAAIQSASVGLQEATSLGWQLSRDSHYQMSNRFAWAWKLTGLVFPVVLAYLGFLRAHEMKDRGKPFGAGSAWDATKLRLESSSKQAPDVSLLPRRRNQPASRARCVRRCQRWRRSWPPCRESTKSSLASCDTGSAD